MKNSITFHVIENGDRSAGILPFTEEVTINFKHDGMLADKENVEFWRQSIKDYFDCSKVYTEEEMKEIIKSENQGIEQ